MGDRLMIPSKYVEELKNETNERAEFPATLVDVRLVILFVWYRRVDGP